MEVLLRSERSYSNGQTAFFQICFAVFFFLFLSRLAILNSSWLTFIFALICFLVLFGAWGFLFIEKYCFYDDCIRVFDHKGVQIGEFFYADIVAWNETRTMEKDKFIVHLLIQTPSLSLVIPETLYRNYPKMRKMLESKSTLRKDSLSKDELNPVLSNPVYKDLVTAAGLSVLLLLVVFLNLMLQKERGNESLHIQGKIAEIKLVPVHKSRGYIEIKLENQPDRFYKIDKKTAVDSLKKFRDETTESLLLVGLPDSVRLTVSKSDYNWKLNNRIVKKIRLGWPAELKVLDYELYSHSRKKRIQSELGDRKD